MPDEVEVYFGPDSDRVGMTRYGMIGHPPNFCGGWLCNEVPPIMLVCAEDVCAAMQPGGDTSYGDVVSTVSPDGMFRIDSADGSWIWELFPATFSDGRNNEPTCYVAVWRD